jgi:ABC-type branched-subunit amino acid transport system ATPase component/Na+/melibiose symporter-like transporter
MRSSVTTEAAPGSDPLLVAARRAIGVTGDVQPTSGSALAAARASGVGVYPLAALSLLLLTHDFRQSAVLVFSPEIADDLDLARATVGAIGATATLTTMTATLVLAALVQRVGRRAQLVLGCALLWCTATALTAVVTAGWQLAVVAVLYGLASASVVTLHQPLVVDAYPPGLRARALSAYSAARAAVSIVVPLLIAVLASALGLGWRPVLLLLGVLGLVLTLPALRLRDPRPGQWDVDQVRSLVAGTSNDSAQPHRLELGFLEVVQHLFSVPTVRRLLYANVGVGITFVPLGTYLLFFLRDQWGLTAAERSLFFGLTPVIAVAAFAVYGPVAERLFRRDPRRLLRVSAGVFAGGVVAVAVAVLAPVFPLVAIGIAVGLAAIVVVGPPLQLVAFSVVPAQMRAHYAALAGILLAGVGGFAGLLVLGSLDDRLSNTAAISLLTVPALVAAVVAVRAGDTLQSDLDRLLLEILDDEQAQQRASAGAAPLLQCQRLVVSFAGVDVLRGVDLTVDRGEIVTLIGANGAGKTTLLNCVSGLRPPDSGIVRLDGRTITYAYPQRRVRCGLVHLPSAGTLFAPLTVRENLHLAARAAGVRGGAARARVDDALTQLPELVPLLDRPADALSGGEQRLAGLARALVLQPRLLLVDELALGLAPALLSRTVALLEQLRDTGTGVLVVEQSVDVALAIASRVYVLENGQVRFAGTPQQLLGRLDLVRATFLGQARGGTS